MRDFFRKIFNKMSDEFFTISNMLSLLRLALIPLIVYLYCFAHNDLWTLIVVVFSTLTDIVDGFIARKFNMITDFGKALDPIADKLTQGVIMICLVSRFHLMLLPVILLTVKELLSFTLRLIVFARTEKIACANWHGKLATCMIYITIALHVIWFAIPQNVSYIMITLTSAVMFLSFAMYTVAGFKMLK